MSRSQAAALAAVPGDLSAADLDAVMSIEQAAYSFPWSRGNFIDSLASGHRVRGLWPVARPRQLLAYCVAMQGFEEMHLLNITVAAEHQGQGLASRLLADLVDHCRDTGIPQLWLEVRESNHRAARLYAHLGFLRVGRRKGYYPLGQGRREDAVLMRLDLSTQEPAA